MTRRGVRASTLKPCRLRPSAPPSRPIATPRPRSPRPSSPAGATSFPSPASSRASTPTAASTRATSSTRSSTTPPSWASSRPTTSGSPPPSTLGEQAMTRALAPLGSPPQTSPPSSFATVTGIASPTIDARIINRMPFPTHVKRTPIFGLGCVAGAAGIARARDYLRAFPSQIALLLSRRALLPHLAGRRPVRRQPHLHRPLRRWLRRRSPRRRRGEVARPGGKGGPRNPRHPLHLLPPHRAHHGLGHPRLRLPHRPLPRRAQGRPRKPSRRRGRLPDVAKPRARRHRNVDLPLRRPQGPGSRRRRR